MLSLQGYGKGVAAARAVRNGSVNGKKGRKSGLRFGTVPLAAAFAFLVALAVLCFAGGVSEESSAVPYNDGTLCYELDDSTRTATVTGHVTGTGTELDIPGSVEYDGNTYTVTYIGESAFDYCSGLTGPLTIPNSVTYIDRYAFSGCSGLTGPLTIPNSVVRINWDAFYGCSNFEEIEFLGSSLPYIEPEAFWLNVYGTPKIYPVKASNLAISGRFLDACGGEGGTVFDYGHTVAVEMYDPNAGTVSGGGTYYYGDEITLDVSLNPGYTFVQWNDGVTDSQRTFTDTSSEDVTYTAYTSCSSFEWNDGTLRYVMNDSTFTATVVGHATGTCTELNIPDSVHYGWQTYTVTAIGKSAFESLGLSGPLTIPNTVTYIGELAFYECSGLTGPLTIPDSVTIIHNWAFAWCSGFTGPLTISNSMNTLGTGAFYKCSGLTGDLTIPGSVTIIHNWAFYGCSSFDGNLTIPDSVNTLGEHAFHGCSSLTGDLTIPDSVTVIGGWMFQGCSGFDGNLTLPDYVTIIGMEAFQGCSGLTGDLTIPDYVTIISSEAFGGCSGFDGNLTIPDSVTIIGTEAFQGCSNLTGDLTIPDSLRRIGWYAFDGCSGFDGNLTIPDSVETIGNNAFRWCSGLTGDLTIPDSVTEIQWNAFEGCSGFEEIVFMGTQLPSIGTKAFRLNTGDPPKTYPVKAPSGPAYPDGFLDAYGGSGTVFDYGHTVAVEMYDPNAGTVSGGGTYYYGDEITLDVSLNPGYTFVQWNDGVTDNPRTFTKEILEHVTYTAYTSCSSFEWNDGTLRYVMDDSTFTATVVGHATGTGTELNIPGLVHYGWQTYTVTAIGDYAFYRCSGLTGPLTIPNTMTHIGDEAFYGCSGLTGLTIPNTMTHIGGLAFGCCTGFDGPLTIPGSVTFIGGDAFYGCSGFDGTLTIPGSVTLIGEEAFQGCSNFEEIEFLGSSLPRIDFQAFRLNTGDPPKTYAVRAPSGPTFSGRFLDAYGGYGTVFDYGHTVTVEMYDPNAGTVSGGGRYHYGDEVTLDVSLNPGYTFVQWNDGVTDNPRTFVNTSSEDVTYTAYTSCSSFEWNDGTLRYVMDDSTFTATVVGHATGTGTELNIPGLVHYGWQTYTVTAIGDYAFCECSGLTGPLTIPNSVTHIGFAAFYDCWGLTGDLTIPDSVTHIGPGAFFGCGGLTGDLTIPNTVTHIGDYAFFGCGGFNGTLTISDSVTYIGEATFWMCRGLTGDLTIPDSVTYIGVWAFQFCSGFNGTLTLSDSLTAIDGCAFYECSGLTGDLTIPDSVTYIGGEAFFECSGFNGTLTLSDSLTAIDGCAFRWCSGLTGNLTIPDSVETIGDVAFFGCSGFNGTLTISDSVTYIGNGAFDGCGGLTGDLTIPDSVTYIGNGAFFGCSNLEEIEFMGTQLPSIGTEAFRLNIGDPPKTYPVKVPSGSAYPDGFLDAYGGSGTVFDYGHTITVLIDDSEAGTVSGGGTYYYGDEITLTAHTNTGYAFVQWNDGVTDNPRTFTDTSSEDVTYTAYTMRTVYSITYHLDGGTNDPSNPATYEMTSPTVTFAAPVKDGYAFKGWYTDPGFAEGYEITEIPSGSTGDVEVYAKFVERLQIAVDDMLDEVYAGFAIEPAVTVRSGGVPIAQDGNYTVSYEDNVNCGTGKATVEGIGDYIGTVVKEFAINPRELTVTTESATKTYDGTVLTASGNVYGFVNWETCTFNVTGSQTCAGSSANTYTLVFDGTAMESNYYVTESLGTLTVDMRALTVNADDKSVTFPGPAPVYTATYGGFADGEDEGDLGGVLTFACGYDGTAYQAAFPITPGGLVSDNYDILYVDGTLTVNRGTAAVPSAFSGLVYDGTERIGVPEGTGYVLADHRKTDAGSYAATATLADGYQWTDGDTGDRIIDWSIAGRELTVTTESATKVYDGTVLTAPGNVCGLVDGETCTFNVTGSQTCAGSSANTYTLVFDGTAVESNYCVMENLGTLTVTRAGLVKPTADTTVFVYDGSEQTYSPVGFDPSTMGIDGNKRTDAGSQTVAVSIADDANFVWADGTEDDVTFAFVIGTKALPAPEGIPSVTYNGNRQVPTVVVRDGSETLAEGTDYEVSWDDTGFTDAKTYTATVTGTGNYHGEETVTYVITQDSPWPDPLQWIFDRIIAILKAILRMFGWW